MGNENEVKHLLEKTKSVFLPENFTDPDGKPALYSLEREFKNSKKNRSIKFLLLVLAFLSVVVVTAVIITSIVQQRSKNFRVDISSFQDLNLKDLLSSSQKQESDLSAARKELNSLESVYQGKMNRIKRDYEELKQIIRARDISSEEKIRQIKRLDMDYSAQRAEVVKKYSPKISEKSGEIKKLQDEIRKNNEKLGNSSNKNIKIIEEDLKLNDLERKKMSGSYENRIDEMSESNREEIESLIRKYNPVFAERELQGILNKSVKSASRISPLSGVENDIVNEKVSSKEKIDRLQNNVSDSYKLNDRMESIPYINSPGKAVLHISAKFKDIVNVYDGITVGLVDAIRKKNQKIKFYDYAFYYIIKDEKESGYILDPRDPAMIGVYMNRLHHVKTGDLGYVFRLDDEFIGVIKFKRLYGDIVAEQIKTEKGLSFRPFDKIMLNKIGNKAGE